jgi:DNA-binding LacI/PurR family transcriptional regulator
MPPNPSRQPAGSPRPSPGKVDIRQVAEESGVSTATVSRVMNRRSLVAESTRLRVLQVADRLHYVPTASARSLRNNATMVIGVLVPDLANPVFVPFLRGVQRVAQAHGYAVLVVDAQRSAKVERRAVDVLHAQQVAALVLAGSPRDPVRIEQLRRDGLLVVDASGEIGSAPALVPDLEEPGIWAMCDALAELEHRRIGYVSRTRAHGEAGRRRWAALSSRCRQLGLSAERVILGSSPDITRSSRVLTSVIERPDPVTALVCATHGLAPTVLRALRAADVDLPGDCSFVTFGDSEWAAAFRPTISAVSLDLYSAASLVTTRVLGVLTGSGAGFDEQPAPARFLPRESSGPPPAP